MYPGRQQFGLRKFLFSRDNGVCKFCMPQPTPTDLIQVTLTGDLETQYTTRLVSLGGIFHVDRDPAVFKTYGGVAYSMDADVLR